MTKSLLIVESPAKARTLKKYLSDFKVTASVGHVKDLPRKNFGVDIENGFIPDYEIIRGKGKIIKEIKKASKSVDSIFLGPDPDREGEAIAWHIAEELKSQKKPIYRVLFNEITPKAVRLALDNPTELNQKKFESQQARRILDRIVGYELSPLLWKKVRRGLSAGRVQSVAVRIIVEREREVIAFIPQEYWNIEAALKSPEGKSFTAKLFHINGKKIRVSDEASAKTIVEDLEASNFIISNIERKERKRSALPPFITSRLQQEAARKFHFTAKRTMSIAQRLYEGIELGQDGMVGLITYMRTDSTRLSIDAINEARNYIQNNFSPEYLPAKPNMFKSKKGAQDAHEAIRPTSMSFPPEKVRPFLEVEQFKLYQLIWKRFLACQMPPAIFDQTIVDTQAGPYTLRTIGVIQRFDGFMKVYQETRESDDENGKQQLLPHLNEGDDLALEKIHSEQKFTQPPARFSEATLIRQLEEDGIGRPSTYASILSTIQQREYVEKLKGRFAPTDLGTLVTDLLVENFPDILGVKFTAGMEDRLDRIEEGTEDWQVLLRDFHKSFNEKLERARVAMRDVKREAVPTEHKCDQCGEPMIIKWGRNGNFLACSSYPTCKNTKDFIKDVDGTVSIVVQVTTEESCPLCSSNMRIKRGKFGQFLACSRYPDCKGTKPLSIGVCCPIPNCTGFLTEKRSRKGKVFYSCGKYPKCTFATWHRPLDRKCPSCGSPSLVERSRRQGNEVICPREDCDFIEK